MAFLTTGMQLTLIITDIMVNALWQCSRFCYFTLHETLQITQIVLRSRKLQKNDSGFH